MELLQCNIVIVKPSEPKILRLNLKRNLRISEPSAVQSGQHPGPTAQEGLRVVGPPNEQGHVAVASTAARNGSYPRLKGNTPSSSPDEVMTPFTPSDPGTSSKSSADTSPCQGSGPLFNNGSTELVARGAILESAGVREKGASFRAFYPDIGDGFIVPGLLTMECSPNSMLQKFKEGHPKSPIESCKPPLGVYCQYPFKDLHLLFSLVMKIFICFL